MSGEKVEVLDNSTSNANPGKLLDMDTKPVS